MVDNLYEDYEEVLNARLDNLDALINDVIEEINNNGGKVTDGLKEIMQAYGIPVDNFESFLSGQDNLLSEFKDGKLVNTDADILTTTKSMSETVKSIMNDTRNMYEILKNSERIIDNKDGTLSTEKVIPEPSSLNGNTKASVDTSLVPSKHQGQAQLSLMLTDKQMNQISAIFGNSKYFKKGSKKKASDYSSKINQYLFEKNNGKVLTSAGLKKLRELLNVKNNDDLLETLKSVSGNIKNVKGFITGSKYIPRSQLAWTQENGDELIFRRSDGAMLTPLGQGSMVFTNEMSKRLWEIASGDIPNVLGDLKTPNINAKASTTINSDNKITISLPNVQDYASFKRELQNDNGFEKFIQEITIGQVNGNNSLNKRKY